jgi:2-oxoglutarate dehydrogenase E2 component (dihydrolipoamide succinyltransferase)
MAMTVTMPQLGETVTEGTILRWAKQVGDTITEDEVLLEISTDKVDTEVPSPAAGTILEILVDEGATVAVGTPLVVIGDAGEVSSSAPDDDASSAPPTEDESDGTDEAPDSDATEVAAPESAPEAKKEPEPAPEPEPQPAADPSKPAPASSEPKPRASGSGGLLSPVVRRLAAEHGIDPTRIEGSGSGGRVTRRDIEAFIESGEALPAPAEEPKAAPTPAAEEPEQKAVPAPAAEAPEPKTAPPSPKPAPAPAAVAGEDTVVEMDRLRVRIAENMIRAKQSAAHVWTSVEVDYEAVEQVRRRHRDAFKEREGFSLTYLPFITRATVDALEEYPVVNSSFDLDNKQRIMHGRIDLGFSVDLDQEGLVVMTVRGADGLRLKGLAREVRRVAEKARSGKMEPDDVSGSTFTITNPGPFGSFMSAPIINVPNVAILSTETIVKRPVVVQDRDGNDAIAIHHIGYLGFSWDHRAFDGSTAVLFLKRIKENLENWDWEQELV